MELSCFNRVKESKGEAKRLRREGFIPAVLYAKGKESEKLAIKSAELDAILRNLTKGLLPTTVFTLNLSGGKLKVLIKEIQYNPVNYNVIHVDFEELHDSAKVVLKVPLKLTGVVHCVGVKQGGTLRQNVRRLKVSCLPKDIPEAFYLDVAELGINQTKCLSDISMPSGVSPLGRLEVVAVGVAKR